MQIKWKLRVGAAIVIANGLLALTAMAPRTALANPCTPIGRCNMCLNLAQCQALAPPGCTATSATCSIVPFCGGASSWFTSCQFQ
jgi:hypothetical protein